MALWRCLVLLNQGQKVGSGKAVHSDNIPDDGRDVIRRTGVTLVRFRNSINLNTEAETQTFVAKAVYCLGKVLANRCIISPRV